MRWRCRRASRGCRLHLRVVIRGPSWEVVGLRTCAGRLSTTLKLGTTGGTMPALVFPTRQESAARLPRFTSSGFSRSARRLSRVMRDPSKKGEATRVALPARAHEFPCGDSGQLSLRVIACRPSGFCSQSGLDRRPAWSHLSQSSVTFNAAACSAPSWSSAGSRRHERAGWRLSGPLCVRTVFF